MQLAVITGSVSEVRSGFGRGVPSDSLIDPTWRGTGVSVYGTYTYTQGGISQLHCLPKDVGRDLMPVRGVSGEGDKPDQPPDTFSALSHAGGTCNPVGG